MAEIGIQQRGEAGTKAVSIMAGRGARAKVGAAEKRIPAALAVAI